MNIIIADTAIRLVFAAQNIFTDCYGWEGEEYNTRKGNNSGLSFGRFLNVPTALMGKLQNNQKVKI